MQLAPGLVGSLLVIMCPQQAIGTFWSGPTKGLLSRGLSDSATDSCQGTDPKTGEIEKVREPSGKLLPVREVDSLHREFDSTQQREPLSGRHRGDFAFAERRSDLVSKRRAPWSAAPAAAPVGPQDGGVRDAAAGAVCRRGSVPRAQFISDGHSPSQRPRTHCGTCNKWRDDLYDSHNAAGSLASRA